MKFSLTETIFSCISLGDCFSLGWHSTTIDNVTTFCGFVLNTPTIPLNNVHSCLCVCASITDFKKTLEYQMHLIPTSYVSIAWVPMHWVCTFIDIWKFNRSSQSTVNAFLPKSFRFEGNSKLLPINFAWILFLLACWY